MQKQLVMTISTNMADVYVKPTVTCLDEQQLKKIIRKYTVLTFLWGLLSREFRNGVKKTSFFSVYTTKRAGDYVFVCFCFFLFFFAVIISK